MRDLFEVERRYHSLLVQQVEKYRGQGLWIHFGETPKLGIRPTGVFHSDPKGVYFYDLDWLLDYDLFLSGRQYATNFPYWAVVKLKNPDGVVMSHLDYDNLGNIAKRQGWEDFDYFMKKQVDDGRRNSPPTIFWKYITSKRETNSLLRGIPYVVDDGTGTIHPNEPSQLVVLDPRSIAIIATGNQYSGRYANAITLGGGKKTIEIENFAHVTSALLKELRARYGGEITFKKDVPSLTINGTHSKFVIGPDTSRQYSSNQSCYKMVARWGRAVKTINIDYYKTTEMPMATLVQFFTSVIDHITKLGHRDLFFTPAISIKAAEKMISRVLPSAVITTEINNSSADVEVVGKNIFEDMGLKLTTITRAFITKTDVDWFIDGQIALDKSNSWSGKFLSYRSTDLSDLTALRQDMLDKTALNNPASDLYRKFYHTDSYEAFLGWLCVNSGISALLSNEDWIEQYEKSDKTILLRDIARVYSRY